MARSLQQNFPGVRLSLQTALSRRLDLSTPIFGFTHSVDVAAAITNAGGLGVLGATRMTPGEIEESLAEIKRRVGDRPFGVDLVLPSGMPDRDDRALIEDKLPPGHKAFVSELYERYSIPKPTKPGMRSRFVRSQEMADQQIAAVNASEVNVFAMGIGSPVDAVQDAKRKGKLVVSLVGAPHHARRAIDAGADVIVAQGYDAGAHTGQIGTFSLVPQVVDVAGSIPVLAAGGVATGRHVAAALAMGAEGVWLGTAWLVASENRTEPEILQKLLNAGSMDTVISKADSGKTLRQLRTSWTDEWSTSNAPEPLRMPYQDILVGDLLGAIDEHKIEPLMHSPAGQSIAYFDEVRPVAEIMGALTEEAALAIRELSGLSRNLT